ncbi:MAG: ferrous iron transporter B, partial [Proteobacteria bacterium]|nr:ferrous iron transporter B [Pseudomonadota bacterium]
LLLMAAPCLPQTAMIITLISPFGVRYVALVFGILTAVALINSVILNAMLKGKSPEMVIEIPSYQMPHISTLLRKLWLRVKEFLLEAAPMIVGGIFVVSIADLLGVLQLIGRIAQPLVVHVLGLPKEAISVILFGFLRKDVSIALLVPLHLSAKQAVIACVFLVLYLPCIATFFVALKESGWRIVVKLLCITLTWATVVCAALRIIL